MIFAALRSAAAFAAQIQAALTPRTIAEAADEHWDEATKRCATDSHRLTNLEVRVFDLEKLAEGRLPRRPVYPGSNPLNHETSATEGEAPAPHGGPSVAESPASSVSADLDDAGPPALTRSDLHNAAFTARIFATNQPHSRDRDHWAQLAARIQHAADATK